MSPRTNSPPPTSYGSLYDDMNDYDYPSGPSTTSSGFNNISQPNFYPSQQNNITSNGSNVSRNDVPSTRDSPRKNDDEKGLFTALLLRPLNIPRRVLSSSVVKCASLMVLYSFCISTVCFIFFVSYLLTFYDDTRRLFRSSRVWAQLRNGVRERIGDDWEEFLQKCFDRWDGADADSNVHLGGDNNNNANNSNSSSATNDTSSKRNNNGPPPTTTEGIPNPKDLEWEEWLKGAVFSFMTVVAGQGATNKFQHSFRGRPSTTTAGGDAGRK